MSRRPKGFDDPRVVQFRPRPKPPKVPLRWKHSLKLFAILLVVAGLLRALYAGAAFNLWDAVFVLLFAGVIALGDLFAMRA